MEVQMLQTRFGTEDGFNVLTYEAGKHYDMAESLACFFLREGWAKRSEKAIIDIQRERRAEWLKEQPKKTDVTGRWTYPEAEGAHV